ncbi:MAG: hypothetical protein KJ767_04040 [Nanoarchaeota archaeon]|nr:hypothetical protein [Nanoarchaeota archaeon]
MEQTDYKTINLRRIKEYMDNRNYIQAESGIYYILEHSKDEKEVLQATRLLLDLSSPTIEESTRKAIPMPKKVSKEDGEALSLVSMIKPGADYIEFDS